MSIISRMTCEVFYFDNAVLIMRVFPMVPLLFTPIHLIPYQLTPIYLPLYHLTPLSFHVSIISSHQFAVDIKGMFCHN